MNQLAKRVERTCGEMAALPTGDLVDRLRTAFSVTVEKLLEVAAIIRILEDRGEDLDKLKLGMVDWFRRIAYGQVLPETFERYRHAPRLLQAIASMPLPDQERLSRPCTVPVLTFTNGEPSERQVDPLEMTSREVRQVFGKSGQRTLAEQRGYLDDAMTPRRVAVRELESGVMVDKRKKCLVINGLSLSRSQLLSYLSHLED